MRYCIYLRKSRADLEAEEHGQGETLLRHEQLLLELAKKNNYTITQIYREIVSGETISARPVMQQLLQEVENGQWDGVLVVEIERLARGDTIDQGIVAQAFKFSGTKIITPMKVYDPENEFDETYFEFGLFMSRQEYRTINRRLKQGKIAAAKEGKWVPPVPPYGYERVKVSPGKGWTLAPVEPQASYVRHIFSLCSEGASTADICREMDRMGVPPPGSALSWGKSTVYTILRNPAYVGRVRYNAHKTKRISKGGEVRMSVRPREESEIVNADGLQPAIVEQELFDRVQEVLKGHAHFPVRKSLEVMNPFAGLLFCGLCGSPILRHRVQGHDYCYCSNLSCGNHGASLELIEERVLISLSEWLRRYELNFNITFIPPEQENLVTGRLTALNEANNHLVKLQRQLSTSYDLLEQGVYDTEVFLERSRNLTERIEQEESRIQELASEVDRLKEQEQAYNNTIPKVKSLISAYRTLPDARTKNSMLKEVLEKIIYVRERPYTESKCKDDFELTLYPKIPKK